MWSVKGLLAFRASNCIFLSIQGMIGESIWVRRLYMVNFGSLLRQEPGWQGLQARLGSLLAKFFGQANQASKQAGLVGLLKEKEAKE